MKKLSTALSMMFLLLMVPALSAQEKPDVELMKQKVAQKTAEMRTAGVSEEEINKFIAESKKKIEQLNANHGGPVVMDEKALMEKLDKKVAQMRAAGASDEEINKVVREFKNKVAEMKASGTVISMDDKAFKEKLEQKVAQMKAAGASDDEIKKFVVEAKQKRSEQIAKIQKRDK